MNSGARALGRVVRGEVAIRQARSRVGREPMPELHVEQGHADGLVALHLWNEDDGATVASTHRDRDLALRRRELLRTAQSRVGVGTRSQSGPEAAPIDAMAPRALPPRIP